MNFESMHRMAEKRFWNSLDLSGQMLVALLDPLLHEHGYSIRPWYETVEEEWEDPVTTPSAVLDHNGKLTMEHIIRRSGQLKRSVTKISHWTLESHGHKSLDIICRRPADLLATVLNILYPDRQEDYLEIAEALAIDDNDKKQYREKLHAIRSNKKKS